MVHPLLDLRFFRSKAGLGDKRTEFTAGWHPPPPREAESLLPSARRPGLARAPHGSEPAGLAPGCGAGAPLPCWCTSVPPPSPCPSPGFSHQVQLLVRPLLTLPSGTLPRPDIRGLLGTWSPGLRWGRLLCRVPAPGMAQEADPVGWRPSRISRSCSVLRPPQGGGGGGGGEASDRGWLLGQPRAQDWAET